jgi:HNH endonuclease
MKTRNRPRDRKHHKPYKPTEHSAEYERKHVRKFRHVVALWVFGFTYQTIGEMTGFTRQYIQQVIRPHAKTIRALRARAKGRCEGCGKRERKFKHHCHHRTRIALHNRLENLALLCQSCHKIQDARNDCETEMGRSERGGTMKAKTKIERAAVAETTEAAKMVGKYFLTPIYTEC